jgi:putative CocE/NonD family hydrolase
LRFFDHYVKRSNTGINEEAPVYYYTMVEECWKSTDTWPPTDAKPLRFFFAAENMLSTSEPVEDHPTFDNYQTRCDTGTGTNTRWDTVFGRGNPEFPDRRDEDKKLLTYDSAPLPRDTEVTGHPIITLHVSSTRPDGQFFVYLEDVFPGGKVIQITEGCLRAIHRKLSDADPPYELVVPYRTFEQADATPLVPGQIAELKFDLLPTSYVFKEGHRIRVAIAGADKDHFRLPEGPPARLQYHRSRDCASCIELPVIR